VFFHKDKFNDDSGTACGTEVNTITKDVENP
jgi:hypothetical protein